ncbi:MAG: IS21 family transposase [bacterium]|nr:IS21 family transposase [bacterium]
MQEKQEIILSYYREGISVRQISRNLGLHRKTVTAVINDYKDKTSQLSESQDNQVLVDDICKPSKYDSSNREKRKVTEELIEEIKGYLLANQEKRAKGFHKQQLKKIDMHELLKESGYDISYSRVCSLVRQLSNEKSEAFIRQIYEPGMVCEFDWGEVKLITPNGIEKYQLAVFTTAYGNYRYARLFQNQDTFSFQQSHAFFIESVGGVHHTFVYDNMKVAVKKFVGPTEKEATEGLLKLSTYYAFSFRFCNIRSGNEKGHVERSVEYIRRKAFAFEDTFETLEDANIYLTKVCDNLNQRGQKRRDNKNAEELLLEEKSFLYPKKPFLECCEDTVCHVDKYATISVKTCYYSVPEEYVGKVLPLKIYPDRIVVYNDTKQIAVHTRLRKPFSWSLQIEHYLQTLKRKPGALSGSLTLSQADSGLNKVYQTYFKEQPRDFISLIEYMFENSYTLEQLEKIITMISSVKNDNVSFDKIKILFERKEPPHKSTSSKSKHDTEEHCKEQLEKLRVLFPEYETIENYRQVI